MDLTELLKFVTKKEASDLHLKPGRPPLLRVNGRLVPLKTDPLSPKEIEDMVLPILTPYQRDKLQQNYAVDIGYGITGVARFRGNIYLQRGTWTAVFRRIPYQIPQVAALNLPEVIETFADLPAGLVLVTGPTGSGKSTTLAAMIRLVTAGQAAETGHLVYSTLHTNSASQTIDRIMDSCPPAQQNQVRRQLALVLKAIVSMQLIDRVDGKGLVPVVEALINSPKIQKQIETGETKDIPEEIESSVAYFRMQSMNQSLIALLVNGAIEVNAAMKLSTDPEDLSLKLRKLFPKIEERGRGGIMSPSANDFSAITELMDVKRLYEEQEDKWKQRLVEKDELIASLEADLSERDRMIQAKAQQGAEVESEVQKVRADAERQRQEMTGKVAQLNDRIRDLNQKLLGTGGSSSTPAPTPQGFFKR